MSMPEIPESKHRPTLKQAVVDLLESIALEEIALSHIVNAEAEKVQAFIGGEADFPMCSSYEELIRFNRSVNQVLDTVLMKEWLLLKKLENVMRIDKYQDCEFCKETGRGGAAEFIDEEPMSEDNSEE
ncbi:hypothetical protein BHU72_09820 [Desulfuribacillus stibiiarsenatis]|uniref:Uncharacterized protein n=1 Tax=Desulfuribacillus stibiiarsenatis TaxID=1390249 RepID=A0A1E5L336_9FIRM|nr:hypothetical protein [Desulfuribacillus stibiiarsenatis]OEH84494.1 hypothetical protein BHU72_09820 [Desulfuribacillus stibiiarsenatis]